MYRLEIKVMTHWSIWLTAAGWPRAVAGAVGQAFVAVRLSEPRVMFVARSLSPSLSLSLRVCLCALFWHAATISCFSFNSHFVATFYVKEATVVTVHVRAINLAEIASQPG